MNKNNPPAFPMQVIASPNSEIQEGMTLRDWFAGMALQATLNVAAEYCKLGGEPPTKQEQAKLSYEYADAMLAEREREKGNEK